MNEQTNKLFSPLLQLFALLLLGIVVSSLIQVNLVGEQSQLILATDSPILLLVTMAIFQLLTFLLPTVIWMRLQRVQNVNLIVGPVRKQRLINAAVLFFGVYIVATGLNFFIERLIESYAAGFYQTLQEEAKLFTTLFAQRESLWLSIIVIGILPGICEEYFFRAGVFRYLLDKTQSFWHASILSSLFFAGIHMNIAQLIPIFLLGMALAFAYYHTKKIWVATLLHAANNTTQILLIYFGINF
jgi:membrane protease YdiL (CAAX protease family)